MATSQPSADRTVRLPDPGLSPSDLMRGRLLAVALEVMNEVGFENATVGMIASRAFVSRATVYRYFANKAEIMDCIIESHQMNMFTSCLKLAQVTPGDRVALSAWLDDFHGLYELPRDTIMDSADIRAATLERAETYRRAARRVIKTWERSGWKARTPRPAEHLLLLYMMMSQWCSHRFSFGTRAANVSREALLDIVSRELAVIFTRIEDV